MEKHQAQGGPEGGEPETIGPRESREQGPRELGWVALDCPDPESSPRFARTGAQMQKEPVQVQGAEGMARVPNLDENNRGLGRWQCVLLKTQGNKSA